MRRYETSLKKKKKIIWRKKVGFVCFTSNGSTSWAMITNWAFLDSIREVTWLRPYLTTFGLTAATLSTFFPSTALTSVLAAASKRACFCLRVSGLYFSRKVKRVAALKNVRKKKKNESVRNEPVFLSAARENWLMVPGTFSLFKRTDFCLWRRMYFGHLTKRVRSRFGKMFPPMLKFLGFFSKIGSCFFGVRVDFALETPPETFGLPAGVAFGAALVPDAAFLPKED